jgi:carbon-monoxide dehydrogenase small subunit
MERSMVVKLKVNGEWIEARVSPRRTLLDFIREDLNLTGTKKGCGRGDCGACVVLIDGRARTTCNLLVSKAQGREITTIEGLARATRLDPVQEAFIEAGAIQCGYCTPGMVLQAKDLLDRVPHPTDREIKEAIDGHICRCTGYVKIVEAIRLASERITKGGRGP